MPLDSLPFLRTDAVAVRGEVRRVDSWAGAAKLGGREVAKRKFVSDSPSEGSPDTPDCINLDSRSMLHTAASPVSSGEETALGRADAWAEVMGAARVTRSVDDVSMIVHLRAFSFPARCTVVVARVGCGGMADAGSTAPAPPPLSSSESVSVRSGKALNQSDALKALTVRLHRIARSVTRANLKYPSDEKRIDCVSHSASA